MDLTESPTSSKTFYEGHIVRVRLDQVRLANGQSGLREVVEHPGAAAIVTVDDNGNTTLVRQFRYPIHRALWEIPAGKLEPGEEPLACARRELYEETGLQANKWEPLGAFYSSPGFCDEIIHLYLARGLSRGNLSPSDQEIAEVTQVPLSRTLEMIRNGEIVDAKTIIGCLIALQYAI